MTFIAAFDAGLTGLVYDLRLPIAVTSLLLLVVGIAVAYRLGWFAAARRHPRRTAVVALVALAVVLPIGFYTISPLFIRSTLVEEAPVAAADASPSAPAPAASSVPAASEPPSARPTAAPPTPTPAPVEPSVVATGAFAGTDDFHYGSGTASIIETAPGEYTLRLEDFSVRNGPDLFVYLSPDADGYVDAAVEVGRLKATDGSFNYALPAGTDPAAFASTLIWCKQFAHLFAVAPFVAD
jgi:Electron transfer DM13